MIPWNVPILRRLSGVILNVFLLGVVIIMTAGVGAAMEQLLSVPSALASAVFVVLLGVVALLGVSGMMKVFSALVPIIVIATLGFAVMSWVEFGTEGILTLPEQAHNNPLMPTWFVAALTYVAYNLLGAIGIMAPLGKYLKGRKTAIFGIALGGLLLAVVAMKFLFPAALERCRATLLELLGADTDFVEVSSAAGRAFSSGSDALTDAYTAVFGAAEVPSSGSSVPRTDDLPGNVDMLQRVLNFDYADPVPAGDITSLFGARSDPLEGGGRVHYGLDIAGEEGAVISAFADGVVTAVGDSTDLGKYVTVTHEGGYSTLYAHCRRITASDGQQVRCGDPIAEMGDTGRATGVHLHFELHQDDVYLNPIYYVTFA